MRVHARFKLYDDARVQGEPFGSATPSGNIEMLIINPEAFKMFRESPIGKEFDVFFSPVEEKA